MIFWTEFFKSPSILSFLTSLLKVSGLPRSSSPSTRPSPSTPHVAEGRSSCPTRGRCTVSVKMANYVKTIKGGVVPFSNLSLQENATR